MNSGSRDEITSQIGQMMNKLWQWHTGDFCPVDAWTPSVNVYRFERRIEICMDVSGLQRNQIHLHLEPGALIVRGTRNPPEPRHTAGEVMRIDAMEIDHGMFCRTIRLPAQLDLTRIESNYDNGLLWIRLALRAPG